MTGKNSIVREGGKIERGSEKISRATGKIHRSGASLGKSNEPDFDSLFEDVENPLQNLGGSLTGEIEHDMNLQTSEALSAAIDARKALEDRFRVAQSDGFYFCLCFQSEEQKEDFLRKAGWEDLAEDRYINGLEIARRMNIEIPYIPLTPMSLRGKRERYKKMSFIE